MIGLDESDEKIEFVEIIIIWIVPYDHHNSLFLLKSMLSGRRGCCVVFCCFVMCTLYFISLSAVEPEKSKHLPCLYVDGRDQVTQWVTGYCSTVLC